MDSAENSGGGKRKVGRLFLLAALLFVVLGGSAAWWGYQALFSRNLDIPKGEPHVLIIPEGADYSFVKSELESSGIVMNMRDFEFTSKILKYDELVKPGRYELDRKMSNMELVRKLRSGDQDEFKFRFQTYRTKDRLAEEVAAQFTWKTEDFQNLINDPVYLEQFGFQPDNIMEMFLPNTYFVYYTTSPEELLERMAKEYENFWTEERDKKAKTLAMTRHEVITLASIVQAETYMTDERPRIAGVYLNRLKRNIPLQADPTVIFAIGDFSIKRVLNKHLEYDSPYNTYLHAGLPPGPINNPEISSIDAVLNYEVHDYLYFCAKEDFSGYHNFAKTLSQHNRNAARYHAAIRQLERQQRNQ